MSSEGLSTPQNTSHSPLMLITLAKHALDSSRRDPKEALKTVQEIIAKNANISYLHYVEANIHWKNARNPESDAVSQNSRNLAFISAKKALELAPNSIEYAHFLCLVLFGLAQINGEYHRVIEECNRGLAIENPQDPGIDSLQEQGSFNKTTKERRVEVVKNKIRSLIGAVETEINRNPVDILAGNNGNVGISGFERIGKKKAETLTRLIASNPLKEKHDAVLEARSKRIEKKYAKASNEIRRRDPPYKVRDFWKRKSAEEKLGLLKVNIDELKAHKNELVDQELIKTVEYAMQEKKWKYWKCGLCQERFADSKLLVHHIRSEERWILEPHLEKMIPEVVVNERGQTEKNEGCNTTPNLDLSSDLISLILDERLLLEEEFPRMGGSQDHKPARISAVDSHVSTELAGSEGFLNWLFGGCTTEEHLHELTSTRKFRKNSEPKVREGLSAAFEGLLESCNDKYQGLCYLIALQNIESKRKEDHSKSSEEENFDLYAKGRNALTEGENLNAYKNEKDRITSRIHELDSEILSWKAIMCQLERDIEMLSAYDDQPYVVHLLKSFIQEKLGILVHYDAAAAEKALLVAAANEKKNVPKACCNERKLKGKSKNRRKNKKQSSSAYLEGTIGSKPELPPCQETIEQNSVNADGMTIRGYEEENQRLDQILEYQRQFEEEARRKQLEKQEESIRASTKSTMENSQFVYGKDSEVKSEQMKNLQVVYGKASEDNVINMEEQLKLSEPVTFICSDIWFGSFRVTGHSYDEGHKAEFVAKSHSDGRPIHFDGGAVSRLSIHNAKGQQDFEDDGRKAVQMEKADDNEDLDVKADVEEGIRKIFGVLQANSKEQQHMHQQSSMKDEETITLLTSKMLVAIGLKSGTVEFDNFLNAIIQSLWHARRLQHEIIGKAASQHVHIGIPCILCGIYALFSSPSAPIATSKLLKDALSELYCYIGFFEKEEVNAASEVLKAVFDCLHQSSVMFVSYCASNTCLDHTLHQIKSYCGIKLTDDESRLASNVISNNLQEKTNCGSNGSNEFMKLEVINNDLAPNRENEERRNYHPTESTFSKLPQIVTIVLEWKMNQNAAERRESLKALSTSLDIGVLYPCLDSGNKYSLVSTICNRGRHYECFAYSGDNAGWVLYNGTTDMMIGQWSDVIARCLECNLLPQVLFFEAGWKFFCETSY